MQGGNESLSNRSYQEEGPGQLARTGPLGGDGGDARRVLPGSAPGRETAVSRGGLPGGRYEHAARRCYFALRAAGRPGGQMVDQRFWPRFNEGEARSVMIGPELNRVEHYLQRRCWGRDQDHDL